MDKKEAAALIRKHIADAGRLQWAAHTSAAIIEQHDLDSLSLLAKQLDVSAANDRRKFDAAVAEAVEVAATNENWGEPKLADFAAIVHAGPDCDEVRSLHEALGLFVDVTDLCRHTISRPQLGNPASIRGLASVARACEAIAVSLWPIRVAGLAQDVRNQEEADDEQ